MATSSHDIFSEGFSQEPWWWQGFAPPSDPPSDLPKQVGTLIVGGGYAGTSCALLLAEAGEDVLVLDADRLGFNASSRSGGQITGGVNVGKSFGHRPTSPEKRAAMLRDAAKGLDLFEALVAKHDMDCGYHATGRLVGFWSEDHEAVWRRKAEELNRHAGSGAHTIGRDQAAAELGSDFYHGGMIIKRAGHVHPARYFGALLAAARKAGARLHGETVVRSIARDPNGLFRVQTARGEVKADRVVLATNAYTGAHSHDLSKELRRRLIPVSTQMIATEELPEKLAESIIRTNRGISESRKVLAHFRKSPDGRRILFGGRASFFPLSIHQTSRMLHRALIARFPQLSEMKLTHGWSGRVAMTFDRLPHIGGAEGLYFIAGCQGSGITLMTYLGTSLAEKLALNRDAEPVNAFDTGLPPTQPFYDGKPWFMPIVGTWYQFEDRLARTSPRPG